MVKSYLLRNDDVLWRDIAGEVVIVREDHDTVHMLNKTASLIWSLADGSKELQEIVDAVCDRFDITSHQALLDIEEFCTTLTQAGLLRIEGFPQES